MSNVVDIDTYLDENAITIRIKGKDFTVKDISDDTQKKLEQINEGGEGVDYREVVASILDCSKEDLEGYGIVALSTIIEKVTQNLFPSSSQSEASTD